MTLVQENTISEWPRSRLFCLFYQFNQISIESLEVVNDGGDNDMYLHRLNEVMKATMNVRSLSQKVDE